MSDLSKVLKDLKIKAEIEKFEINASVSNYYLRLHSGSTVSKLEKYSTEIALAMKSFGRPIIKPILSEGLVQLEFINQQSSSVSFADLQPGLQKSTATLPAVLGMTYNNQPLIQDITTMPHILLAGTTGSGKSVSLHALINGLILSKRNVKFVMIDPKIVELSYYKDIKQLHFPIATDYEQAYTVIEQLVVEMNNRYELISKKSVTNIQQYNKKKKMPYIVCIIDEFADLIMASKKDLQRNIALLAQKGRACGIHMIISTQRPSAQVINGVIKANFPSRICFKVSSGIDSRIVLGQNGAEKLNGMGDGILSNDNYEMLRFKGAFITSEDIQNTAKLNKKSLISKWFGK